MCDGDLQIHGRDEVGLDRRAVEWIAREISECSFDLVDFSFATLSESKIFRCVFRRCKEADLSDVEMSECRFLDCQFDRSHLGSADILGCRFEDCGFQGANMLSCDLSGSDFLRCRRDDSTELHLTDISKATRFDVR